MTSTIGSLSGLLDKSINHLFWVWCC